MKIIPTYFASQLRLLIFTGLGKKLTAGSGERRRDKAGSGGIKWWDCGIFCAGVG